MSAPSSSSAYHDDDVEHAPFLSSNPDHPRISTEEDNASLEEREVHVKAEIDTGEVADGFSWAKLWKYTGPGRFGSSEGMLEWEKWILT